MSQHNGQSNGGPGAHHEDGPCLPRVGTLGAAGVTALAEYDALHPEAGTNGGTSQAPVVGPVPGNGNASNGNTVDINSLVERIGHAATRSLGLGDVLASRNGFTIAENGTIHQNGAANGKHGNGAAPQNGATPPNGATKGHRKSSPLPGSGQLPAELIDGLRKVDIMESLAPLNPRMQAVEREIDRLITTPVKLVADIAAHVLGAGGKRLRPALTLLSGEICGDNSDNPAPRVATCAALVELTHTTTLLHDDVVDSATTRRGRPSANRVWGNETSVLVGDYLFAQVFVTASRNGIAEFMHPLANATAQMCAGELLETQMRGHFEMTETQYLEIIALKTGSLTECACRMGALAVEGTEEQVEALGTFGRSIGMAFQIVDDLFDVIATESHVGKPVGNDLREGAITLPMLRAEQVSPDAPEFRDLLVKEEKTEADVDRALAIMRASDAVAYSMRLAREYADVAKAQLELFPHSQARSMLADIADYVLSRDK